MPRKKLPGMKTMTTAEKLTATEKLVVKYKALLYKEAIVNNVTVGDAIVFNYGRGDKVRPLSGVITGIKDTPTGRFIAVLSGEGFDSVTYKVRVTDITENSSADARLAQPEVDPLTVA